MCGITGILCTRPGHRTNLDSAIESMTDRLTHRGPDDKGLWVDSAQGVALGHRRLSVIDLSPGGHQPMVSDCGRYVLSYNGEVYNFEILREELQREGVAPRWRGHSDSEVILSVFARWGVERALQKLTGMFALALWDREERMLYLARDRMGEKPLYYGWSGSVFLFGSELKALAAHPDFEATIDRDAAAHFFRVGYIPAPYSIYVGIHKLLPGSFATVRPTAVGVEPVLRKYWYLDRIFDRGANEPFDGSPTEAVDVLEECLSRAVRGQMYADVPLGAFLSGGIDSSTVVALMQAQNARRVRTFSIGFHEPDLNEAGYAKAIADHLGTDHTELYIEPAHVLEVIPRLPCIYDEPFADPSQIPTFLVAQLARQRVTVSLSGDGGDELFHGYDRYDILGRRWSRLAGKRGRRFLGRLAEGIPESGIDFFRRIIAFSGGRYVSRNARMLQADSIDQFFLEAFAKQGDGTAVVFGSRKTETHAAASSNWLSTGDDHHRMQYLDAISYLPDDILVKLDRATMAVSLESRVPLLDHSVVELAARFPTRLKKLDGRGKYPLRVLLERYVPRRLFDRPKQGFAVPLGAWIKGPLRDWAEDLLDPTRMRSDGILNTRLVRGRWLLHVDRGVSYGQFLWNVLMFQSWLRNTRSSVSSGSC